MQPVALLELPVDPDPIVALVRLAVPTVPPLLRVSLLPEAVIVAVFASMPLLPTVTVPPPVLLPLLDAERLLPRIVPVDPLVRLKPFAVIVTALAALLEPVAAMRPKLLSLAVRVAADVPPTLSPLAMMESAPDEAELLVMLAKIELRTRLIYLGLYVASKYNRLQPGSRRSFGDVCRLRQAVQLTSPDAIRRRTEPRRLT